MVLFVINGANYVSMPLRAFFVWSHGAMGESLSRRESCLNALAGIFCLVTAAALRAACRGTPCRLARTQSVRPEARRRRATLAGIFCLVTAAALRAASGERAAFAPKLAVGERLLRAFFVWSPPQRCALRRSP
jgi:hypothetical protein